MTNNSAVYNRPDIIKKEAIGIDYRVLGEIQEFGREYIKTQKGIIKENIFYFPKQFVDRFDGVQVWFKITEKESLRYKKDNNTTYHYQRSDKCFL